MFGVMFILSFYFKRKICTDILHNDKWVKSCYDKVDIIFYTVFAKAKMISD